MGLKGWAEVALAIPGALTVTPAKKLVAAEKKTAKPKAKANGRGGSSNDDEKQLKDCLGELKATTLEMNRLKQQSSKDPAGWHFATPHIVQFDKFQEDMNAKLDEDEAISSFKLDFEVGTATSKKMAALKKLVDKEFDHLVNSVLKIVRPAQAALQKEVSRIQGMKRSHDGDVAEPKEKRAKK